MRPEPSNRVLVVDDEAPIRELVTHLLQADGFTVLAAPDGSTALHVVDAQPVGFACILLDLMLPDVSGLEVLGALRARGCTSPVIALSAHRLLLAAAQRAGVMVVVPKPFDGAALLAYVRGAAPQSPKTPRAPVDAAGLPDAALDRALHHLDASLAAVGLSAVSVSASGAELAPSLAAALRELGAAAAILQEYVLPD
jgi:DNA-binding response OmpR family regulator